MCPAEAGQGDWGQRVAWPPCRPLSAEGCALAACGGPGWELPSCILEEGGSWLLQVKQKELVRKMVANVTPKCVSAEQTK